MTFDGVVGAGYGFPMRAIGIVTVGAITCGVRHSLLQGLSGVVPMIFITISALVASYGL
jgi:hypothetical protein